MFHISKDSSYAGATRRWPALSGEKMIIIDALSDPRAIWPPILLTNTTD